MEIKNINIGSRRPLGDITELKKSIEKVGLLNPVTIDGHNNLIAGYHRIEACRALGWTEISTTVLCVEGLSGELAEIDENLIRNNGTELDRADWLLRRKEIYEELWPETKKGQYGHKGNGTVEKPETEKISFSEDTADKVSKTARAVRNSIKIAKDIEPEVKEQLQGEDIADNQSELLRIAKEKPAEQIKIATAIKKKRPKRLSKPRNSLL